MRIMMISVNDMSSSESPGVTKKLSGQFKAFQSLGHEVYHLCLNGGNGVLIGNGEKEVVVPTKPKAYFTIVSLFLMAPKLCAEHHIDMCYIRYPLADWAFMRMVKGLHGLCRVVVEIPTYPYDHQVVANANMVTRINFFQDKRNRRRLSRYVDLITNYDNQTEIYSTPCVSLTNGIDITRVRYLGDELVYKNDIQLIGVARIQHHHGYDCLVEGMRKYYQVHSTPKVYFHIVGDGEARAELEDMVTKYALGEYIIFHGVLTGKALEEAYLSCNTAVGELAAPQNEQKTTSSLKNKEYCAVGIPIIHVVRDNAVPCDAPYYKLLEHDGTSVDVRGIVEYFEFVKSHPEIHKQMRRYAEEHLSWERQMEKVVPAVGTITERK